MPAAAVIPAPIAYVKVAAVKKLVVDPGHVGPGNGAFIEPAVRVPGVPVAWASVGPFAGRRGGPACVTSNKSERSKQVPARTMKRRDNRTGRASPFCWFRGSAVMINRDGRGLKYSTVRSEIRGTGGDSRSRRRSSRTFSLIKSES